MYCTFCITIRDGDVFALRQEVENLKGSLKENQKYTEQLKKELQKGRSGSVGGEIPLSDQVCL